jgi:hypothetical protein
VGLEVAEERVLGEQRSADLKGLGLGADLDRDYVVGWTECAMESLVSMRSMIKESDIVHELHEVVCCHHERG